MAAVAAFVSAGIAALTFVYTVLWNRRQGLKRHAEAKNTERQHAAEQRELAKQYDQRLTRQDEQIDWLKSIVEPLREMAESARISATQPRIAWRLIHDDRIMYYLRNVGTETATNIRVVDQRGTDDFLHYVPEDFARVPANGQVQVGLLSVEEEPGVAYLMVTCDQWPDPQAVTVES